MIRILNAAARAIMVMAVIAAPAFLLPGASRTGQEISLIMGGIVALFTLFEYASVQPGLVDFRYAPPYNRFRFFSFAAILIALVFLCRATVGADEFSDALLALVDTLVSLVSFPMSPLNLATNLLAEGGEAGFVELIQRAGALSLFMSLVALVFFTLFIWVLRWPAERQSFNLWINLPSFDPTVGKDISWRLRRSGLANVFIGLALPYAVLAIVSRSGGWFEPSALANYQPLIWGCLLWAFLPVVIIIRGMAMLKIAWLIDKARTD